jgi:hypothetical protein
MILNDDWEMISKETIVVQFKVHSCSDRGKPWKNSVIMVSIQAEIQMENLPYISHTLYNSNRSLRSESVKKA